MTIEPDDQVPRGLADCTGKPSPGPLRPWGQLVATSPPLALDIGDNRSALGRALDSDLVANIPEVSRHQAVIIREGEEVAIIDSGSANGTLVNGRQIGKTPHPLLPGDTVTMGDVDFTFRLL